LNFANERRVVDYIHAARLADFPRPVVVQAKRCFAQIIAVLRDA
jgi:hypothetical protein